MAIATDSTAAEALTTRMTEKIREGKSKRYGVMLNVGWDYALYAELWKRTGDLAEAKENLSQAIAIFKECGADGWLKRAQEALAKI